jgi:predicted short-subunit dehydrogenase-like oxidoreductase (DUF2520 family)
MFKKPAISIFGTGAVGSALQDFLHSERYEIRSVWNTKGGFIKGQDSISLRPASYSFPKSEADLGDWIFIATPDDQIRQICGHLAVLPIRWSKKTVIHCSGSLSSSECELLAQKGSSTFSMHPIQTFRKGDGKEAFEGIYISIESENSAKEDLISFVRQMNATPLTFTAEQKQAMHIAAVFASNYLVSLMENVENLLKDDGIEEGLKVLEPLIRQTVQNIFEKGVQQSLSGPISRGDSKTVGLHLNYLKRDKQKELLYKLLGSTALKITREVGSVEEKAQQKLKKLLEVNSFK